MCGRFRIGDSDIFPGMEVPIIGSNGNFRLRWGITGWSKPIINARVETINSKPMFKDLLEDGRYLIEANGFYEWPYYFYLKTKKLFYLAVLGNKTNFVVVTTKANEAVEPIHPRMPVIFKIGNENSWLGDGYQKAPDTMSGALEFQNKLIS